MSNPDRFYFDIFIKNPDVKTQRTLTTSAIHWFVRNRALSNIGISFPEFKEHQGAGTMPDLGSVVRLVSVDREALYGLRGGDSITYQVISGAIAVSKIKPVPATATEVCFVRNRETEMAARRLRKLTGRNDIREYDLNRNSDDPAAIQKVITARKSVYIFLKRVETPAVQEGVFNSYGFCCQENMVSVPWF